tara:strand:+ start:308 stop:838 length:531 start_codon:yes stop_codon:yes gene_type:complete
MVVALLTAVAAMRPVSRLRPPHDDAQRCSRICCCSSDAVGGADDGSWRIGRARLEEQWSATIRKRKRRFLPFASARQWARAMHFTEEEDWRQWINDGEKRNPYIPSYPDEVYAQEGWSGWQDFLNGPIEDLSTILKPGYQRGKWLRGPLRGLDDSDAEPGGDESPGGDEPPQREAS